MPEKWTGRLVGKMHNERVTIEQLATQMGVSKGYVSMILNGQRNPAGAKERLNSAFDEIMEGKRNGNEERH